jgi:hypothetical protein
MNVKVADSGPYSHIEKHLQKHRDELYFYFNLRNLYAFIRSSGSFLALIFDDGVPFDLGSWP